MDIDKVDRTQPLALEYIREKKRTTRPPVCTWGQELNVGLDGHLEAYGLAACLSALSTGSYLTRENLLAPQQCPFGQLPSKRCCAVLSSSVPKMSLARVLVAMAVLGLTSGAPSPSVLNQGFARGSASGASAGGNAGAHGTSSFSAGAVGGSGAAGGFGAGFGGGDLASLLPFLESDFDLFEAPEFDLEPEDLLFSQLAGMGGGLGPLGGVGGGLGPFGVVEGGLGGRTRGPSQQGATAGGHGGRAEGGLGQQGATTGLSQQGATAGLGQQSATAGFGQHGAMGGAFGQFGGLGPLGAGFFDGEDFLDYEDLLLSSLF
ncbi:spidroin-1-like [Penaeus indicus]|uniref:spidroin-1-like n=1 Tax=Penaeus indicus TaxID=29960 RepID=UPI00300C6F86